MAQFESKKEDLSRTGVQLVFIAAEKQKGWFKPVKFMAQHPVSFPFLLDEDRSVTKVYGLHHRLGLDAIDIARPASLVIDQSGTIRFIYRGDDQRDRVDVNEVIAAAAAHQK